MEYKIQNFIEDNFTNEATFDNFKTSINLKKELKLRFIFSKCVITTDLINLLIEYYLDRFNENPLFELNIIYNTSCSFVIQESTKPNILSDEENKNLTINIRYLLIIQESSLLIIKLFPQLQYNIELFLHTELNTYDEFKIFLDLVQSLIQFECQNISFFIIGQSKSLKIPEDKLDELIELLIFFLDDKSNNLIYVMITDKSLNKENDLITILYGLYKLHKYKIIGEIYETEETLEQQSREQELKKQEEQLRHGLTTFTTILSNHNDNDYKKITTFFFDKYTESFKLEQNPKERAQNYITSIISNINKSENSNNSNKSSNNEKFKSKQFIDYLLYMAYNFKQKYMNPTFHQDFTLLGFHGSEPKKFSKLPNNCTLVFLSPINYALCAKKQISLNIISRLKDSKWQSEFKSNPLCFGKSQLEHFLSQSMVYLPGQYFPDLELYMDDNDKIKFNNMFGEYTFFDDGTYSKIVPDLLPLKMLLSLYIKEHNLKGFIFIESCRSARIDITLFYRYEHLIRILNKSVWFYNSPSSYDECEQITHTDGNTELSLKFIKLGNSKYIVSNKSNTSHSTTYRNLERLGFTRNLIKSMENPNFEDFKATFDKMLIVLLNYDEPAKQKLVRTLSFPSYKNLQRITTTGKTLNKNKSNYFTNNNYKLSFIDLLLSFLIYNRFVLGKTTGKINDLFNFYNTDNANNPKQLFMKNLYLSSCELTTKQLDEILNILKPKSNYTMNLYLQNNKITNILLELLQYTGKTYLSNNPLVLEIVNPSKYLDISNLLDKINSPLIQQNEEIEDFVEKLYLEYNAQTDTLANAKTLANKHNSPNGSNQRTQRKRNNTGHNTRKNTGNAGNNGKKGNKRMEE